jgi:hypothetical protein
MAINRQKAFQAVGVVGLIFCIIAFFRQPSFPTPDKLIIFLFFDFPPGSRNVKTLRAIRNSNFGL